MEDFEVDDNGKKVKLTVRALDNNDYEESDRIYASSVAGLIRDKRTRKLLLRQELDQHFRENNIWTDADEKRVADLQNEINELLKKLKRGGGNIVKDGRGACIDINNKRKEIVRIMAKRRVLDDSTIESLAESDKIDYLIYCATIFSDTGKNYWTSFEDMKADKLSEAYRESSKKVLRAVFGVDLDFEKSLPENKWMRKYNFIDEDMNYIDRKTGERVDKEGNPLKPSQQTDELTSIFEDIVEEQPFLDEDGSPVVALVKSD